MKKVILSLLILVAIIAGAIVLIGKSNNKPATSSQTSSSQPSQSNQSSSQTPSQSNAAIAAATITYSGSGFSPAQVTVHSGDTVAIKNASSQDLQFNSNPHPIHTDDTDLNVGEVAPGRTIIFTVTQKGTFGYHNHFDPTQTGTIVIE